MTRHTSDLTTSRCLGTTLLRTSLLRANLLGATLLLALLAAATSAFPCASGALEISQVCVASGCFPGDTAGFPVTITEPGSYCLTSNLDLTDEASPEDTTAIEVSADQVVLDLGGHAILGVNVCSGSPPDTPITCTATGSGYGVRAEGSGVTIRNGTISGMGDDCVYASFTGLLEHGVRIEGLTVSHCGDRGLTAQADRVAVAGCNVFLCGGIGINFGNSGGSVTSTLVAQVGGYGIRANSTSVVADCSVLRAADDGITLSNGVVHHSSVSYCGGDGIEVTVSTVADNAVRSCVGFGVVAASSAPSGIGGNTLISNNGGNANAQTDGALIELAPNICGTDTICRKAPLLRTAADQPPGPALERQCTLEVARALRLSSRRSVALSRGIGSGSDSQEVDRWATG